MTDNKEVTVLTPELIYGFTQSLIISQLHNARATPEFHMELWRYMCDEHDRVAVAAPRGHAKSTAVSLIYALANICFRCRKHILIVSSTEAQAVAFLGILKMQLNENADLVQLFGIKRLEKETETEIIGVYDDGSKFRVIAKGSGQGLRGTLWRFIRPDLIIGDDLENDDIVMNDERRLKFKNWFYNALLPCGSDDCIVRIVGTILHLDSLLESFMPELGAKDTVEETLRQYSNKERDWLGIRFRAHTDDFSEILWPERFDKKYFVKKRNDYVRQGIPEGYSQEYLNYPIDAATSYFRQRDFFPIGDDSPEEFYVACDLAISEKSSRAFTVMCVAAVTSDGKLRFRDIVRFRGDALEIIEELFRLNNIYKPETFFIEQENIARTLGPVLNKEMQERDKYFSITPMTATQDKIKRARALQARMRAGMVECDMDAEWFPAFQQELLQFPRGKYMDQVDSAAWIAIGLDSIISAPTKRELEEEEWLREEEESYEDLYDMGRNGITGY